MEKGVLMECLRNLCLLGSFLGSVLTGTARAEPPKVLASIPPIHSLTAAVMEGIGEPELLVPGSVSEHDYVLKPSDLRKIAEADLVVWVGAPLESYLVKALETEDADDLELIDAPGMEPRRFAEAGAAAGSAAQGEDRESKNDGDHAHYDLGFDPHIWLDPVRAQRIARLVADKLGDMDPDNVDQYRENAARLVDELDALDRRIRERLAPVAAKPFVTFHDGYRYFVDRYGLNQVGQLTIDPDRRPGAATVRDLQATFAAKGVDCAFAEPQFDAGAMLSLAGQAGMRIGTLDTIGADLQPGPGLYASLLANNADAIEACLSPKS
jgi:zinc transport system substrate-binding protein